MFSKKDKELLGDSRYLSEWMREATQLQKSVCHYEAEVDDTVFTTQRVRRSAVYVRQDVVLLVSLLDSLNKQVYWIKIAVCAVAAAVLFK